MCTVKMEIKELMILKTYSLSSAAEMAVKHPDTFQAPSFQETDNLKVGDNVKLCFNNRERMWVEITELMDYQRFKGVLRNTPIFVDLMYGEEVEFEAQHIYAV